MKKYTHLNDDERLLIQKLLKHRKPQREIAELLGRSPSTISREIRRNIQPGSRSYCGEWGQRLAEMRKPYQYIRGRKIHGSLEDLICDGLKNYWSPKQISGRLKKEMGIEISHESIYRYIYSNPERHNQFRPFLRQGTKLRRKPYGTGARHHSPIPNRVPIEERPKVVESKQRVGDWECDTVIGANHRGAFVTLVDRKSLYCLSKKVDSKSSDAVTKAIISLLKPVKGKVYTLTFDNGGEFAQHEKIAKALGADAYFANPYSSWERGINENTNGLLRQFFPKGTDFTSISQKQLNRAVELLNTRPRETRGYATPNEMFNEKEQAA